MTRPIAILDMETDPFDNITKGEVRPFLAILASHHFEPFVMLDENWEGLIQRIHDVIVSLPQGFIIYAHNGGRFDFMYLLKMLRGKIQRKGKALMSAHIGKHELRDSYHILPESLKKANTKEDIDYGLFNRWKRKEHYEPIIKYCLSDCMNLLEIVEAFVDKFGTPLTIGQAAMKELRKSYDVDSLSEGVDAYFRNWFYGGRVECLHKGYIAGDYAVYDVNSMYPSVMADYPHPVSANFSVHDTIRHNTMFITLRCKNNGAFVTVREDGGYTYRQREGIFSTTVWEYEVACKYALISDVSIIRTISFERSTDFGNFVRPIYANRQDHKQRAEAADLIGDTYAAKKHRQEMTFGKYLLNNAYGKFAQNPRKWKEHVITEPGERPEGDWNEIPHVEHDDYWIWDKPTTRFRFNNVATAASITGAARSVLLDALHQSNGVLYCDTDSLICHRIGEDIEVDKMKLGAWDREAPVNQFYGCGKKLYGYRRHDREPPSNEVIRAKGMTGVTWNDLRDIANGQVITKTLNAPTLNWDGTQEYKTRQLRMTA